jgi:acetylornithine/succinyldiaminopimelate/putrescine aminotransferase
MLRRGFILLPEGGHANVISFTPPLTITRRQLQTAVDALEEELMKVAGGIHDQRQPRSRSTKRRRPR